MCDPPPPPPCIRCVKGNWQLASGQRVRGANTIENVNNTHRNIMGTHVPPTYATLAHDPGQSQEQHHAPDVEQTSHLRVLITGLQL